MEGTPPWPALLHLWPADSYGGVPGPWARPRSIHGLGQAPGAQPRTTKGVIQGNSAEYLCIYLAPHAGAVSCVCMFSLCIIQSLR